jgi:hypothetical protein
MLYGEARKAGTRRAALLSSGYVQSAAEPCSTEPAVNRRGMILRRGVGFDRPAIPSYPRFNLVTWRQPSFLWVCGTPLAIMDLDLWDVKPDYLAHCADGSELPLAVLLPPQRVLSVEPGHSSFHSRITHRRDPACSDARQRTAAPADSPCFRRSPRRDGHTGLFQRLVRNGKQTEILVPKRCAESAQTLLRKW